MPRSYKRKTSRAASYTEEALSEAIRRVRAGELSNYAASAIYGIPKSTLNDRVLQKTGLASKSLGRPPAIPTEIEAKLANCLRTLEKWGWGLSRYEVLDIVAQYIKANKIKTPFKDGRPGPDWFIAFKERNKLSIKKPQSVEYLRKRMTDPFVISEYFGLLKETLTQLQLDDPNQIWNLDETSVALDPSKTKVVGGIGKPCTRTTAGTGKENITVLTTVNAAGRKLNPLIVYKGKHVYQQWLANEKAEHGFEIAYAASKRGWMETEIFLNYFKKVLIPSLGEKRPLLMIYDGHSTHVNPEVISIAIDHQITILKLPAHTSHLLQPLDLAVFKSFKAIWDRRLIEWQRQNVGTKLRKQAFAEIFAETWYQTSAKVIINGFRKGGIFPFNENVIPIEKYDPQAYKRWIASQNKFKEVSTLQNMCLAILNRHVNITKSASPVHNEIADVMGFEELLLNKLSQRSVSNNISNKLKRIAKGAEVITLKMLTESKETGKKRESTQTDSPDYQIPGPSKTNTTIIKKNRKIKKGKFEVTTTADLETDTQNIITDSASKLINTYNIQRKKIINNSDKTSKGKEGKTHTNSPNNKKPGRTKSKATLKKQKIMNSDISLGRQKINEHNTIIETCGSQNPGVSKINDTIIKQKSKIRRKNNITKTKRHSGEFSDSTTSESGDISTHSDSDIIDLSDLEFSDIDRNKNGTVIKDVCRLVDLTLNQQLQKNREFSTVDDEKQHRHIHNYDIETDNQIDDNVIDVPSTSFEQTDNTTKKVTILSSVRFSPDNCPFVGLDAFQTLQLNKIDPNFDISQIRKRKSTMLYNNKGKENIMSKRVKELSYEDNKINEDYSIGDKVLVRYYTTVWKYYVGVIEGICMMPIKYNIRYYKSVGKGENVKFTNPKRKDCDTIPENLVVKKVQLLQIREDPDEYVFMNDEDAVYFE